MKTDESLMLEFQKGERAAFEALFGRYRDRVFGFFRRRLAQAARAEDLTQETFLAVLRGTERWEPRALFRTWLFAIAMKQLFAERRKRTSHPEGASPQPNDEFPANWEPASEVAPHDAGPEQGLWVRQALARLEEDEREILMLREYEQLSYDEIAALLSIPVNTVRSRLFRARMALRDALLGQHSGVDAQPQREANAEAARWLARPAVKLEGGS